MKVWWCEEHGERGYVPELRGQTDPHCWVRDMGPSPCRLVERQLVPHDTLKDVWWCEEHGYQATEYAVNHPVTHLRQCWGTAYGESDGPWDSEEDYTPCRIVKAVVVLDALAAAQRGREA